MADKNIFTAHRQLEITGKDNNFPFPVLIQYPTHVPSITTSIGPYQMDVSVDADIITGQRFPLVILSHGNNGSPFFYRTISTWLAQKGFIVALPAHYGNNSNAPSAPGTVENLTLRPRHMSLVIDHILADPSFADSIDTSKIAVIGHSIGAYTALALAGGQAKTEDGAPVAIFPDSRIKAMVLLAPATVWLNDSGKNVNIPILLLTAEHDDRAPAWHAEIVFKIVTDPALIDFREIKNAGHYSFLSPFPETMKKTDFPLSTDPDGFDRAAFHQELPVMILDFLKEKLDVSTINE
ncbi:alpha/beta hydrolase family protein [Chitinophaga agrisoli]|nr:alpha/beta fold hydrolase [Chitinophaga agrisoli]